MLLELAGGVLRRHYRPHGEASATFGVGMLFVLHESHISLEFTMTFDDNFYK